MKARRLVQFAFNIIIIVGLLLPYSSILFNGNSFYFSPGKLAYCAKPEDCRHEIGHVMDDDMNHISRSKEFGTALMLYVMYQIKYTELDKFGVIIFTYPGMLVYSDQYQPYKVEAGSSPQEELYARLYAEVDGDISKLPVLLQQFYKSDRKYDEAYASLINQKFYVNIRSTKMDQLKALFEKAKVKVEENKEMVIRATAGVVGALLGAVVTALVINQQSMLDEEITMSLIDDDEEETDEE